MSSPDSNPLVAQSHKKKSNKEKYEPAEHDDFTGVIINASKSINVREIIIIWIWFLVIHSEIFIERFLSKIPGSIDDTKNLTMNGTFYLSIFMIIGVILIDMIYR